METLKKKPEEEKNIEETISQAAGGSLLSEETSSCEAMPDPFDYGKNIPGGNEDIWHNR